MTEDDYLQQEEFLRQKQDKKRSKKEEKSPLHSVLDKLSDQKPTPVEVKNPAPSDRKVPTPVVPKATSPVESKSEKLASIQRIVEEKKHEPKFLSVTRYLNKLFPYSNIAKVCSRRQTKQKNTIYFSNF